MSAIALATVRIGERMLRSNSVRAALALVLIAVVAIEGYYLYRYYGDLAIAKVSATDAAARNTTGDAAPYATTGEERSIFVHRAAPDNISDVNPNSTYLDDPLANGHPDAFVTVTQNWNPGGGDDGNYNAHPIGVWYDASAGRWAIFNQDRAPMPNGAAFNVIVTESPAQTG